MQRETRRDTWAQYGELSRSARDGEGIRARFLADMLNILLVCFGLLFFAALGAAVIWEAFGVAGVIAWWFVLGIAAVMFHHPNIGLDQGTG